MIDIDRRCGCGHLVTSHRLGDGRGCIAVVQSASGKSICNCKLGREEARDNG